MSGWTGIFAPAGTPKLIVDKISGEMANILSSAEIVDWMGIRSLEPFISNPEQFAALLRSDMVRFAKLIKDANIKVEAVGEAFLTRDSGEEPSADVQAGPQEAAPIRWG